MKKRKGYIIHHFRDGDVVRPIDDEIPSIPRAGFLNKNGAFPWPDANAPLSETDELEWYKAQDQLDEMARERDEVEAATQTAERQKKGGQTRGQQTRAESVQVAQWLHPFLENAYQHLIDEDQKISWRSLQKEVLLNLRLKDGRRGKVTEHRVKQWLKEFRRTL